MINIEYANAYSEVIEILRYISKSDYDKIPKDMIELFNSSYNKNYVFEYNQKKTLEEQNVSELTRTIIAILFRDYWATEKQREKIINYQSQERIKIEQKKLEKYNPNNLFQNKKMNDSHIENTNLPIEMKEKVNIFTHLFNIIKKIFKNH